MNPRYVKTFNRRRKLFSLPVVLAAFFALWYIVGAPKSYVSASSLWFDNAPSSPSSVGNTNAAILPPSSQEQQVLTELLTTRSFRLKVARSGPLARYLAHHSATGWGPTAVLKSLRGGASLDDRIMAALGPKQVITTIAGPQVLGVELRGPTPAVASGTLTALVNEFERETNATFTSRGQAAVTYFEQQVASASTALQGARQAVSQYLAAHPAATVRSDISLRSLSQAEKAAAQQLLTATNTLNQAKLNSSAPAFGKGSFRVLDSARVIGPVSSHKKELAALIGGLFVGGLVSLLGIILYTKLEEAEGERELAAAPAAATVAVATAGTGRQPARTHRIGGTRRARAGLGRRAAAVSAAMAAGAGRVRALRGTTDVPEPEVTMPPAADAAEVRATTEVVAVKADEVGSGPDLVAEVEETLPSETVVDPKPLTAPVAFGWGVGPEAEPDVVPPEPDEIAAEPELVAEVEEAVAPEAVVDPEPPTGSPADTVEVFTWPMMEPVDVEETNAPDEAAEPDAIEAEPDPLPDVGEPVLAETVARAPEPEPEEEAAATVEHRETAPAEEAEVAAEVDAPASEAEAAVEATVGWEGSRAQHLLAWRAVEMPEVVRVSTPEGNGAPDAETRESDDRTLRG
ncbi:MAG TPA: hypothetical protein VEH52_08850, partial [Gaiellaceae bacterium]|nr:hypothetical protein [Gaiellaceae bacterium]